MNEPFLFHIDQEKKGSKVLEAVISDLKAREEKGIKTYGTTLSEAGLSRDALLQHLYEELLDACMYIKALQHTEDLTIHKL